MKAQENGNGSARASLELLYHVSSELASALDLHTVLDRVIFLSMQNVGAISGSIIVLDDHGGPIDYAFRMVGQTPNPNQLQLQITYDHGLAGWVAKNRQAVLLNDTRQDERWLRRPDDADERTGAKSAISMPVMARDRLVGVITLVHSKVGFFKNDHLALLQAISDQAGIAILNARLYQESQRKARVMTAVAESAAVITASLDSDEVLNRILEQISHALRAEFVSLALIDSAGKKLEYRAATGEKGQKMVGLQMTPGQGIAGWVAQTGVGAIIPEVAKDPRFYSGHYHRLGIQVYAVACAPIRSQGQVIGVLEAINPLDGVFDQDALLVLTGIGSLAGTAIHHAQLFESLRTAHQRYRELFEDSVDLIFISDWDGNIIEANRQAEETTGLSNETLRSLKIDKLCRTDEEKVGQQFSLLSSGATISYESTLFNQVENQIPVQVYVKQVQIDGVPHLQWILRDISERKNLDRMREDLISMIYHDLRSPLANIVSSLDVLASMLQSEKDASFKSLLNIAVRSTERIQRLTNSLLDINRLEAGQPIINYAPADPITLVSDAIEVVAAIAKTKGLEISLDLSSDLPHVLVDADMIRRVLVNLLENAIKFTPSEGKIYVRVHRKAEFVRFSVEDSGPGIPHSESERIFDKFTRLNVKDSSRGLGLGLAYCRLAVNGHGGRIWVESEPGSGSKFKFTLPIATNPAVESTPG